MKACSLPGVYASCLLDCLQTCRGLSFLERAIASQLQNYPRWLMRVAHQRIAAKFAWCVVEWRASFRKGGARRERRLWVEQYGRFLDDWLESSYWACTPRGH